MSREPLHRDLNKFDKRKLQRVTPEYMRGGNMKLSLENRIALCKKICDLYATGKYTIRSICNAYGVSYPRFAIWSRHDMDINGMIARGEELPKNVIPEVHNMFKDAKMRWRLSYNELCLEEAQTSLLRKVKGFESEEVTEEYEPDTSLRLPDGSLNPNFGKMKMVARKVKKRTEAPSDSAIQYALNNLDPANWKNRYNSDKSVDIKIDASKGLEKLTLEELESRIAELNNVVNATTYDDDDEEYEEAEIVD